LNRTAEMKFRLLALLAAIVDVDAFALAAGLAQRQGPVVPLAHYQHAAPRAAVPAAHVRLSPVVMAEAEVVKETATRSLVKAIGWRFTAGVVTAMTSFFFTGSLAMAASIVGWDLCSKSITMFLGERLWNNVDWGKDDSGDTQKRSIAKALAWRAFAATNTLIASIVLTKGKAGVAGKIAGTDSVVKTILFYFYERAWVIVPWGKFKPEDSE